jgi:hypothetical protein
MKDKQTIKRGAVWSAPVGLAGFASRILPGAVALLLIPFVLGGRAWAITGGEPDNGRHPNVCAAIARHPVYGLLPFSGTLIHPRVILTAGHAAAMVASGEATLYGVSVDQNANLADPSTWLPVSAVAVAFTGVSCNPHGMEIGAIILGAPVAGITPATLPPPGLLDRLRDTAQLQPGPNATKFTVVGYGFGLDWPPPQRIYPASEEGIVTRNAAQSAYMSLNDGWLHLSQSLARGYGGTALGDSGGPVFWTDPGTSQEYLVGITSGGDMRWVAMGTYFRVDTVWSRNFILGVIDSLGEQRP